MAKLPNKNKKPAKAKAKGKPLNTTIKDLMDETEGAAPIQPVTRVRTRTEIRAACAELFDVEAREIYRIVLERVKKNLLSPAMEDQRAVDIRVLNLVTTMGQQLASLGVGQLGVGSIDPADIPNLPAPVFQTASPDAPLPDGKPEE